MSNDSLLTYLCLLIRRRAARFSEYPLGRLLQGLETYTLLTYTLVVAFDDVGAPTATNGPISKRARETESFSAVRIPTLDALIPGTPKLPRITVPLRNERSSAERLASWVSRRLSGRNDPESLRLWNQRDVEAVDIDGRETSSVSRAKGEISRSNSIASYYFAHKDVKRTASLEKKPRKPRSMLPTLPYDDIPPVPSIPASRQIGKILMSASEILVLTALSSSGRCGIPDIRHERSYRFTQARQGDYNQQSKHRCYCGAHSHIYPLCYG